MPPQASTLIRLVMETLGVNGATALARELGMTGYGVPRKIGDWIEGRFAPNYEATMLMLERAGFLNLDANAPRQPAAGRSPLSPRQQYLLQATQDSHPQDALAVIFSTPQDQIQAELQTARDELANWQETRSQEQTRGEQETEPAEQPPTPEEEAIRQAVFQLTGKALPENFDPQHVGILTLFMALGADLEKRVEGLEQAVHPAKSETE